MASSFFSKFFKTFVDWLEDKHSKSYETRISRYMEKHPKATLAEARGHKPRMFRVTVGLNGLVKTHVYRNFTSYKIVPEGQIEAAKVECREDVIRQATRWLGYNEDLWWTKPTFGEEVLEVEM